MVGRFKNIPFEVDLFRSELGEFLLRSKQELTSPKLYWGISFKEPYEYRPSDMRVALAREPTNDPNYSRIDASDGIKHDHDDRYQYDGHDLLFGPASHRWGVVDYLLLVTEDNRIVGRTQLKTSRSSNWVYSYRGFYKYYSQVLYKGMYLRIRVEYYGISIYVD